MLESIVDTKKSAHKGLAEVRNVMKCDIGNDQKPLVPNMGQVEHTCTLLDEKEKALYSALGPEVDHRKREYLAN